MDKNKFDEIFGQVNIVEQEKSLLFELVNIVENIKPLVIVEIGVNRGGTLNFWRHIIPDNGIVICIDNKNLTNFSDNKIRFVEGNSTYNETYQKFISFLSDREIDFLFIDGGHTYFETKSDFYSYGWHVRNNGLIAFHDTMLDSEGHTVGSTRHFWEEIKTKKRKYWDVIYDKPDVHTGLGILKMNWM